MAIQKMLGSNDRKKIIYTQNFMTTAAGSVGFPETLPLMNYVSLNRVFIRKLVV